MGLKFGGVDLNWCLIGFFFIFWGGSWVSFEVGICPVGVVLGFFFFPGFEPGLCRIDWVFVDLGQLQRKIKWVSGILGLFWAEIL